MADHLSLFTRSDAQRAAALLHSVQGSATCVWRRTGRDGSQPVLPLALSPEEALTVLEERRDLVVRSQDLLAGLNEREQASDDVQALITDHMRTRLPAEYEWLLRAIAQLQHQSGARIEAVVE